jgi:asparagine synthase (glutamine-hydrolysing)
MFRYFAFAWDPAAPAQAASAQRLEEILQYADDWRLAHAGPGLCVFTTGSRAGVNESYALPRSKGVVLGHLFRRRGNGSPYGRIDLPSSEGERILQSEGRALVDDYWGRYVTFIRPDRPGTVVLRDPSGTLPCYQTIVEGVTFVYSWLEDLLSLAPHLPTLRVDWTAIAAFVLLRHLGGRETALEGVSEILPGQRTLLGDPDASPIALWSAAAIAGDPIEPSATMAIAQLREEVVDCVQSWASIYDAILMRLSGGVDSAILLGSLLAKPNPARITCLNYHSPGSDSDERRYARLAAARGNLELVERERNVDVCLESVLAVSRTPIPEIYVGRLGADHVDAEVASASGARAMFTGGGGDQLFFELKCTWPAADYLSGHGPGAGFWRASMDAARLGNVSVWHSMWRALVDQRHRNDLLGDAREFFTLAKQDAFDDVRRIARYVHPEMLGEYALPIGKSRQLQMLLYPAGYYDPYLREAAPELVNPLVSQPLIELCLKLPTWLLTHGGQGRGLARLAFAGDIPREIAQRKSKGGMEAYVSTILRRNVSFVRALLLDGHLVSHGLLDRQRLEAALDGRLSSLGVHASEIHHCVAIEAWLRRFVTSPSL